MVVILSSTPTLVPNQSKMPFSKILCIKMVQLVGNLGITVKVHVGSLERLIHSALSNLSLVLAPVGFGGNVYPGGGGGFGAAPQQNIGQVGVEVKGC